MTALNPHPSQRSKAVVLLSGGMDSAVCLAIARAEGRECHAISFAYGQRHAVELEAARRVASSLGAASHRVVSIDLAAFGGSALTAGISVPKSDAPHAEFDHPSGIPVTYVPARNTVFLSYALAVAEVIEAGSIYIGVNAVDYSGYPDCRPRFVDAFQRLADLATRAGVEGHGPRIVAPLVHFTKKRIVQRGIELGVDFGLTSSCYDPGDGGRPCGGCDACRIRAAAFAAAGMADPANAHA